MIRNDSLVFDRKQTRFRSRQMRPVSMTNVTLLENRQSFLFVKKGKAESHIEA